MTWPSSSATLGPLFTTAAMAETFGDRARIQAMLDVEVALAKVEAQCGIISQDAAALIASVAWADAFNFNSIAREAVKAGNLALPLIRDLTRAVAVHDAGAANWVHWGATSQDIVDTGLVLQMRSAFALIEADLTALCDKLADLAEAHARTPMIARTLMQQTLPTAFGLKAAGWLSALMRARQRLAEITPRVLVLQFGGAAGTLAALGADGHKVAEALASELRLGLPDLSWHSHRDRIAETGAALALLTGSLGKMARDLALMAQTEVGEFSEGGGEGATGAQVVPHKTNTVACGRVIAIAQRTPQLAATLIGAMDQEFERGLGGWLAEWEALPELFRLAGGALAATRTCIEEGRIHEDRMRTNLGLTAGLIMADVVITALSAHIGKDSARRFVRQAVEDAHNEGVTLRAALGEYAAITAHFEKGELDALCDPANYLGAAPQMALAVVEKYRAAAAPRLMLDYRPT